MEALVSQPDTNKWHPFIISSKLSLKDVLHHNGNKYRSVLIVYTIHMKAYPVWWTFSAYLWKLESGCTSAWFISGLYKSLLFFCESDNWVWESHYSRNCDHWFQEKHAGGQTTVSPEFLLPVNSRLGLMKDFVQAWIEMAVGISAWNRSFKMLVMMKHEVKLKGQLGENLKQWKQISLEA